jgi:hypothetical protein
VIIFWLALNGGCRDSWPLGWTDAVGGGRIKFGRPHRGLVVTDVSQLSGEGHSWAFGSGEVGSREVGSGEVDPREVRSLKIGINQSCPS